MNDMVQQMDRGGQPKMRDFGELANTTVASDIGEAHFIT